MDSVAEDGFVEPERAVSECVGFWMACIDGVRVTTKDETCGILVNIHKTRRRRRVGD